MVDSWKRTRTAELVCQRATEHGDESDTAYFLCWLAWLETQAGDPEAAQAAAQAL
jgi:hypothetical protein